MAAATGWAMLRAAVRGVRAAGRPMRGTVPSLRPCSTQRTPEASSPYKDKPWEYLDSDEYQQLYGDGPVWVGYKRNHKGAIPPQRTRRTCVRKGKRVGNPCPICRDQNLHVDYRNVKLLEQFVCPHSGSIFHPTHTGVCMKQHKLLLKAIAQAQDHGLLWLRVPFVPPPSDDYLTIHSAIGKTPPGPQLKEGRAWYPWYQWQQPPAAAIARLRRIYKDYLKEEEGEQREAEALNKEHKTGLEMGVEGQEKGVEGQKGGIKG